MSSEYAQEMIDMYNSFEDKKREVEQTDKWRENNMEYDLRSCEWICDRTVP